MTSSIKLGTTAGNLAALSTLFKGKRDREPRVMPMTYSRNIERGDGTRLQAGWVTQIWHWDVLTDDMADALRAFIGPVYIQTRTNTATFATYTAVLVWPEEEPEHFAGRVLDLNIELRKIVTVTI